MPSSAQKQKRVVPIDERFDCGHVVKDCDKGDLIYDVTQNADTLYLVLSGRVVVRRVGKDGRTAWCYLCGPDEYFGEDALGPSPGTRSEKAEALDADTKIMSWPNADIRARCQGMPNQEQSALELAIGISDILFKKLAKQGRMLEAAGLYPIKRRIAYILLELCEQLGSHGTTHDEISLAHLTHGLLSNMSQTSRELITLTMNQLKTDGLIYYGAKRNCPLVIPSVSRLRTFRDETGDAKQH
jgi:CRP/FNR family transcriptional regulator